MSTLRKSSVGNVLAGKKPFSRNVIRKLAEALNTQKKPLNGSKILLVGLAYKANVDDDRESPGYVLMDLLKAAGAEVAYYDPYIPVIRPSREHSHWAGTQCIDWTESTISQFDAALIATMDGELDCRGFWSQENEHPDKDAVFTTNADVCPTLRDYVAGAHVNFGRVRTIKLEPQDRERALPSLHRDDNNRFNPEGEGWVVRTWLELTDNPASYMLLMDSGPDGLPDPATEMRVPLHRGARFVVDTQRLWHVVAHPGSGPRYALITSFESGPALDAWVQAQLP